MSGDITEPASLQVIDLVGLKCPEPVMMLHVHFRQLLPGQRVRVLTSDPTTERDIPKFCQHLGHRLIETGVIEETYEFVIEKGA
jgi:tRNA 2-thiouridine synthesizing protein A